MEDQSGPAPGTVGAGAEAEREGAVAGPESGPGPVPGGVDDGTNAVLFGMFTSFTEALGDLEARLGRIEAAVRASPPELAARLAALDASLGRLMELVVSRPDPAPVAPTPGPDALAGEVAALVAVVGGQSDLVDRRTNALTVAIEELRAALQAHADETAHSLGRRAGEAGRRLAGDLGLWGRSKATPPGS